MNKEIEEKLDYIINKTEDDSLVNDYAVEIENYIKDLENLTDKYEEEHRTVFQQWLKEISILSELEEWLKKQNTPSFELVLDKIQELKEKYNGGKDINENNKCKSNEE